MSAFWRKSIDDPTVAGDEDVKLYFETVKKFNPNENPSNENMVGGYFCASLYAHALALAGDDLTHANILRAATTLRNFKAPLLPEGVLVSTSSTDYEPIKNFIMMVFNGERYVPIEN
jgi:hypothetical protein